VIQSFGIILEYPLSERMPRYDKVIGFGAALHMPTLADAPWPNTASGGRGGICSRSSGSFDLHLATLVYNARAFMAGRIAI
jgi:hypothetical protein